MSIHRSRNALIADYIPNNHVLEHVQENPHLGVIISENLKWGYGHQVIDYFEKKDKPLFFSPFI
jgi:hypothetical protein